MSLKRSPERSLPTRCGPVLFVLAMELQPGSLVLAQQHPDFRKTTWGMTQAQVMATEPERPAEVRQSNGEVIVKYDPVNAAELVGRLIYIFAGDKLVRAKYVSSAEHSELNDFIVDFHAAEPLLAKKYGTPVADKAVWEDDAFQQEPLPYLDQDRALASDILASDQHAGLSVSLGYLRLFSERRSARTKVVHALTGGDHRITHQIEYRSVDLEAFENQVLHRSVSN
jgi:hypothetical protein